MFRGVMSVLAAVSVLTAGCTVEYKSPEEGAADEPAASESIPAQERLSHSDFHDAVLFTGGQSATLAAGWDYESCAEVDTDGRLTEAGCQYAIELHFEAPDEGSKYGLLLLAAPAGARSEGVQEFAAEVGEPEAVNLRDDAALDDPVAEASTVAPAAQGFALVAVASTSNEDIDLDEQVSFLSSNMSDTLENLDEDHHDHEHG